MPKSYTLFELAEILGADLRGEHSLQITGLATLQEATTGQLSFLGNKAYERYLSVTNASAVILNSFDAKSFSGNALILDNPYLGYAQVSKLFATAPVQPVGVHSSAVVDDSCEIHSTVSIGPNAVIGANVSLGANTSIGAGCYIGDHSILGADCHIYPNVSIYHGVVIGNEVIVHSCAVIGADGFGFAPNGKGWTKIHQIGGVIIGDRVEIGASSTIDRGALGNTEIADGVIIDNQVMIAHNVKVGENTAMAAFTGISGSTTIGKNCTWAGRSGSVGHVTICDGAVFMGNTVVMGDVKQPGIFASGTPLMNYKEWRKCAVRFGQLDDMFKRIRKLEK
jgi:UDP-3-O-[3-hydroxymyristoyl] glucosamine N-acyltransferase